MTQNTRNPSTTSDPYCISPSSLPHLRLGLLLITSLSLNSTHNLNNPGPQPLLPSPLFLPPNFYGHPIFSYHRLSPAVDKYIRPILLFPALRLFCNVLLRLVQRRTLGRCFCVDAYVRGVFDYLLIEVKWCWLLWWGGGRGSWWRRYRVRAFHFRCDYVTLCVFGGE
jgi:hypothetical protein